MSHFSKMTESGIVITDTLPTEKVEHLLEPWRLTENVWVARGEIPHRWNCLAYVVQLVDHWLLVDPGSSVRVDLLLRNLKTLGVDLEKLTIAITHAHWDHASAIPILQELGAAPTVLVPELSVPIIASGDPSLTATDLYPGQVWEAFSFTDTLKDGKPFLVGQTWILPRAVPGHSPDSMLFIVTLPNVKRILFAGDFYLGGYSPRIGSSDAAWLESLDKLEEMEFDWIVPGHFPIRRALPKSRADFFAERQRFGQNPAPGPGYLESRW